MDVFQSILIYSLPVIFAITVHEAAHAFVAKKLGDDTAYKMGRVSFNPIVHIDIVGTIVLPVLLLALGGFLFGWAKPVPVRYGNLNKPKRDMALVALAGPFSNLLMAVAWGMITYLSFLVQNFAVALSLMGQAGVVVNLSLMLLNLLPIPPLDGWRILDSFLPPKYSYQISKIEPYGFFILLALMMVGALGVILVPMLRFLLSIFSAVFGMHGLNYV